MIFGIRQAVRRRAMELLGGPRVLRLFAIPGVSTAFARALTLRAKLDAAIANGVATVMKRLDSH